MNLSYISSCPVFEALATATNHIKSNCCHFYLTALTAHKASIRGSREDTGHVTLLGWNSEASYYRHRYWKWDTSLSVNYCYI